MKRSQVYWLCQILGWSAHGVVNATFASLSGVPLSRAAAIRRVGRVRGNSLLAHFSRLDHGAGTG